MGKVTYPPLEPGARSAMLQVETSGVWRRASTDVDKLRLEGPTTNVGERGADVPLFFAIFSKIARPKQRSEGRQEDLTEDPFAPRDLRGATNSGPSQLPAATSIVAKVGPGARPASVDPALSAPSSTRSGDDVESQ